ncbi:hypothetical protein [Hyphococcus sp.]|uniref:hypothetical protein n=1 Tax=Hyphococcus sp. TaxID=2038636 RepID=UPI002081C4D1|nr:MAG: hypothetical protein DHS20C04_15570 [Marinicaulis sp.]
MKSRSPQIAAAARIAFANWVVALQCWLVLEGAYLTISFALIDLVTAFFFFRMSHQRWFPAPLCFTHGVLAIFHVGTFFNTGDVFWEKFVLNRAFDLELAYICACALFRIAVTNDEGRIRRA